MPAKTDKRIPQVGLSYEGRTFSELDVVLQSEPPYTGHHVQVLVDLHAADPAPVDDVQIDLEQGRVAPGRHRPPDTIHIDAPPGFLECKASQPCAFEARRRRAGSARQIRSTRYVRKRRDVRFGTEGGHPHEHGVDSDSQVVRIFRRWSLRRLRCSLRITSAGCSRAVVKGRRCQRHSGRQRLRRHPCGSKQPQRAGEGYCRRGHTNPFHRHCLEHPHCFRDFAKESRGRTAASAHCRRRRPPRATRRGRAARQKGLRQYT